MASYKTMKTTSFNDFSSVVDSSRVAQFLAAKDWTIQSELDYAQVWAEPDEGQHRGSKILLPRDTSLEDYGLRLEQAVARIGDVYGWSIEDFAEQVLAIHADLFFVRVDQAMIDGTIPFRQASSLLEGIDDMLRSSAITANNPHSTGRGRVPERVNRFLNDDVRMGHTKRGSFIITVAARIDSVAEDANKKSDGARAEEPVPSFSREVTTTLAKSLEATKQYAEDYRSEELFDDAVANGMRLPLVKALEDMGGSEGLRSLDLSFEWAPSEPMKESAPVHVEVPRETIELLPQVEERLIRKFSPENVTLTGPVVELKRGEVPAGEPGSGEIVLRADIEGVWRKVSVPLEGADYDDAIQAHSRRFPFTVSGKLEKVGRSWKLTDEIVVDRSFIDFRNKLRDR